MHAFPLDAQVRDALSSLWHIHKCCPLVLAAGWHLRSIGQIQSAAGFFWRSYAVLLFPRYQPPTEVPAEKVNPGILVWPFFASLVISDWIGTWLQWLGQRQINWTNQILSNVPMAAQRCQLESAGHWGGKVVWRASWSRFVICTNEKICWPRGAEYLSRYVERNRWRTWESQSPGARQLPLSLAFWGAVFYFYKMSLYSFIQLLHLSECGRLPSPHGSLSRIYSGLDKRAEFNF